MSSTTSDSSYTSSTSVGISRPTLRSITARPSRFDERFSRTMSTSAINSLLAPENQDPFPQTAPRKMSFEDFLPAGQLSTWDELDQKKKAKKVGTKVKRLVGGLAGFEAFGGKKMGSGWKEI